MYIRKKSGSIQNWRSEKIRGAILLANARTEEVIKQPLLEEIADMVLYSLRDKGYSESVEKPVDIETVHEYVMKALLNKNLKDTHQQYSSYRNYKQLFSKSFIENYDDSLRIIHSGDKENANKDSSLNSTKQVLIASGTMKKFMTNFVMNKEYINAHDKGYIHLHDLPERFLKCSNCIDENGWITIKKGENVSRIQLKELDNIFEQLENEYILNVTEKYYILGRNGWTKLEGISKRPVNNTESVFKFKTRSGLPLIATDKHRIPVIRNGKEILLESKDIKVGDELLSSEGLSINPYENSDSFINLLDPSFASDIECIIVNLKRLKKYIPYKYDCTIQDILRKEGFTFDKDVKYLTREQFKILSDIIDIPYDIFSELRIKAKNGFKSLPILLPITESLAKVYGYIYADGNVYVNKEHQSYQTTFYNTNIEILNDFINCMEEVFNIKLSYTRTESSTSPCYMVKTSNRLFVSLFSGIAGGMKKDSGHISLPSFIINSTDRRVKLAYLSACIDTDGHLSNKMIGYTTSSEKYSDQIMMILKELGYNPIKAIRKAKGTKYRIGTVCGTRNFDNYVIKILRQEEIYKLYNELSCIKENKYYEKLEDSLSREFKENKILKIELYDKTKYVYDLETESKWFIVNDYIVHNCSLFDMNNVLKGGFELNGIQYSEPGGVQKAFDVAGDVALFSSGQQYGK